MMPPPPPIEKVIELKIKRQCHQSSNTCPVKVVIRSLLFVFYTQQIVHTKSQPRDIGENRMHGQDFSNIDRPWQTWWRVTHSDKRGTTEVAGKITSSFAGEKNIT